MHVETEGVTDDEHGDNNEEDDCILLVWILDAILLDKHKDPPADDMYDQERNKPQDYQRCPAKIPCNVARRESQLGHLYIDITSLSKLNRGLKKLWYVETN